MRVVFVGNNDPIFTAAQTLATRSDDECFSARELAETLGIPPVEALAAVENLYETDWCFRESSDGGPLTYDERWGLIRKSLTLDREYEVLVISDESYCILDDPAPSGRGNAPVLFHQSGFRVVDPTEPTFWDCQTDEEGRRSCFPPKWRQSGLFEDYFDGVAEARKRFWEDMQRYYPKTWEERKRGSPDGAE